MQQYLLENTEVRIGDCWPWRASLDGHGYGNAWNGRTIETAHRVSYRAWVGEIPAGLCVLHTCDNRRCVNPEHLWLGTRGDNNRDARRKGRAYSPPRTGCGPHGQPTPCRQCATERQRRHRARKAAMA